MSTKEERLEEVYKDSDSPNNTRISYVNLNIGNQNMYGQGELSTELESGVDNVAGWE